MASDRTSSNQSASKNPSGTQLYRQLVPIPRPLIPHARAGTNNGVACPSRPNQSPSSTTASSAITLLLSRSQSIGTTERPRYTTHTVTAPAPAPGQNHDAGTPCGLVEIGVAPLPGTTPSRVWNSHQSPTASWRESPSSGVSLSLNGILPEPELRVVLGLSLHQRLPAPVRVIDYLYCFVRARWLIL